jgi:hypothetical protein
MTAAFQPSAFQATGFHTVSVTPQPKTSRPSGGGRPWPNFPQDVLIVGETDIRRLKSKREEILFIFKP